jgi:hypothetical protein
MTDRERNIRNGFLVEKDLPPEEESLRGWIYDLSWEELQYAPCGMTMRYWDPEARYWRAHGCTMPFGEIQKFYPTEWRPH